MEPIELTCLEVFLIAQRFGLLEDETTIRPQDTKTDLQDEQTK